MGARTRRFEICLLKILACIQHILSDTSRPFMRSKSPIFISSEVVRIPGQMFAFPALVKTQNVSAVAPPVHHKSKCGVSDTPMLQVGSIESVIEALTAQSRANLTKVLYCIRSVLTPDDLQSSKEAILNRPDSLFGLRSYSWSSRVCFSVLIGKAWKYTNEGGIL